MKKLHEILDDEKYKVFTDFNGVYLKNYDSDDPGDGYEISKEDILAIVAKVLNVFMEPQERTRWQSIKINDGLGILCSPKVLYESIDALEKYKKLLKKEHGIMPCKHRLVCKHFEE